jgi:crotonobetainyl-CoA:carnitine CoA-transferase CaiB-like acyl-CoA transferase
MANTEAPTHGTGPLKGITVVELAHVMAGPTCGRMLADLGADVIKVERVPGGDDTRRDTMPTEAGDPDSHAFMMMNRNKRGIALNLKSEDGRQALRRLLARADVVIENYRHDTMQKLGLGYDDLHAEFPGLVYCAISGFGRTGPYAHRGGFDLIAQGMSGLMSITGEGPGRPPVKIGPPITDIAAGMLATMGVVSALYARHFTGKGQLVDTSLFEAGISFTYWHSAICFAMGDCPGPLGSAHPLSAPYQSYQTADGWINIGGANQSNWIRLLNVLGASDLEKDPRFADNEGRMSNLSALNAALTRYFKRQSTAYWLRELETAGVPAGPLLSVKEMHSDPQTLARDMVVAIDHPRHGSVNTVGFPVKFSETPASIALAAPMLGQHTLEVLTELGYSVQEVESLVASGSVIAWQPQEALSAAQVTRG